MDQRFLRLLAACAIGALAGSSALAAESNLSGKAYSPTPVATWAGFYVGANAGYGWASVGDSTGSATNDLNGFIGGGQIGYNWQGNSPLVIGIEADYQGSAQSRSDVVTLAGIAFTVDQDITSFATVRARIGYAFDRVMLYGTGGWAYLNYNIDVSALGTKVSSSTSSSAWTAGAGLEWMLWNRWSTKLEYLYIDTGSTSVTLFGVQFNARAKDNIFRIGLNYHF